MSDRPDDFNWRQESGAIVVPHQDGIAVYENPDGDIVLRVEGGIDGYAGWDDECAVIPIEHAEAVGRAILRLHSSLTAAAQKKALPPPDKPPKRPTVPASSAPLLVGAGNEPAD